MSDTGSPTTRRLFQGYATIILTAILGVAGYVEGVRYMQLTALLIRSIQDQQAEIIALKARVAKLERGR
jgi:cell division protein FtsB